jgi:hypothetical protein
LAASSGCSVAGLVTARPVVVVIDSGGPVVDASAAAVAAVDVASAEEGSAAVTGDDGSSAGRVLDVTGRATGVNAPSLTCGVDVGGAATGGAVPGATVALTVGLVLTGGVVVTVEGGVVVAGLVVVVVVVGGRVVVVVVERLVVVVVVGLGRADAMGIPAMRTIAIVAHETSPAIHNSTLRCCLFKPDPNRRTACFYPTGRLVHQSRPEKCRLVRSRPLNVTTRLRDCVKSVY